MRRRSFTLIETLIAFSLASLIIGALFFWFNFLSTSHKKTKTVQTTFVEERFCDQRLTEIFSRIRPKSTERCFYSLQDSRLGTELIFHFDNGPHLLPQFAGIVLGQLYLDIKEETLCFCVWPFGKSQDCQIFPLLNHVKKFELEFFEPPHSTFTVEPDKIDQTIPPRGWQNHWKKEFEGLPSFIKVKIQRSKTNQLEERTCEWTYDVQAANKMITFGSPKKESS